MPLPGIGVAPTGGLYNELTAVTRRAFVPKLFVQLYFASPTLYYLMGGSQRAAGGLNQVTIPMQGQSMVQGQFTGYGGGFNSPQIIPGIQNGQFNLAYWVVPIPLPFGETVLQATDREISVLKARMNDAYAVTRQNVARLLFTNNTGNSLFPDSFINAFDNGTNAPNYGGINRLQAGNSAFQGQYINVGAAPWNASAGMTRAIMAALLEYVTDNAGGETPTFVVMNPADHATLNTNFIANENQYVLPGNAGRYDINSAARSSFPNLNVSGIPIFADHFVPKGNFFGVNVKYSNLYVSEDAFFDFSGFYSLVPLGQIGQQGVCIFGYDFISAKSVSGFWAYNLGGASW